MAAGLTDHVWTLREVLLCRVPPWPRQRGYEHAVVGVGDGNGRVPEVAMCACIASCEGVTTVQRAAVTPGWLAGRRLFASVKVTRRASGI